MHASHKAGVSGRTSCCGHSTLRCSAPRLPLRSSQGSSSGVRQVQSVAALPPAFVGQLVSTGIIAVGAYLLSKQESTAEQVCLALTVQGGGGGATQACAVSTPVNATGIAQVLGMHDMFTVGLFGVILPVGCQAGSLASMRWLMLGLGCGSGLSV
jgi:hypothetical protein